MSLPAQSTLVNRSQTVLDLVKVKTLEGVFLLKFLPYEVRSWEYRPHNRAAWHHPLLFPSRSALSPG